MRIACTGFVSTAAGSVASANALLLQALADAGWELDFFSKPSFVDPRPLLGARAGFRFVPVVNARSDAFRQRTARLPGVSLLTRVFDARRYNQLLVRRISEEHRHRHYDLVLWLGDYAHGTVPGVKTVSFVQGPPGTDARSVLQRYDEIKRLAGRATALKWKLLATLRLSALGLPALACSDHFIVGSGQSRRVLHQFYGIPEDRISTLPYPIDLELFHPAEKRIPPAENQLRVLWLGRIIPRKRLDLFLDGAAEAIRRGANLQLTIVGNIGFIPGYENLIAAFPFPDRLQWLKNLPREQVPALLHRHDVLIQPSEEENFGSSVAEAQACGITVIVGPTNGNCDYLSERDIRLEDYESASLAKALTTAQEFYGNGSTSNDARAFSQLHFSLERVNHRLTRILKSVGAHSHTIPSENP